MNWSLSILIACIGSCLIYLPVQAIPHNVAAPAIPVSPALSPEQVREVARSIAVKVLCGDTCGSGILIAKQGQIYTVLTNDHVLTAGYGKPYRIQTPDGRIYPATVLRASGFGGDDLGLLQFGSSASYRLASLPVSSTLAVGDRVFAAGFPVEAEEFVFNSGEISLILDRALGGGYQIGYTNDIQKGMSGGPVLNDRGEVVGINAIHAYPLWERPYVFKDGSIPSAPMQQEMMRLSWAVPVQTFLELGGLKSSLRTVIRERPNSSHQPELLW
ncbi:S1 family peptidase [Argonema antarcticum]|uniref:S1 family peptidase n=1 Tax=Argonema antarcticum TaxID=2942763 RepID=UPI0020125AE9|nr:serine protease [Argonema antarcticum]MCL1471946.1 serine protease [Argonema antarcticum A004/B2]